jgi:hypothetical protein
MDERFCQSCGMPMGATDEMCGTKVDGSKSEDYCKYCYDNGAFTSDCSMNEMIEFCVPHMATAESGMSEADARKTMQEFFPTLKRWKTA